MVSFLVGVITALIFMIPYYFKYRKKMNECKKKLKGAEKEVESLNEASELAKEEEGME